MPALLPADAGDLDEDTNIDEMLPLDITGKLRVISLLDIGAHEYGTPNGLEQFRAEYSMAPDGSEDHADRSGNGIGNLNYFAFGLGDISAASVDTDRLPEINVSGIQYEIQYTRLINPSSRGLFYTVQTTDHLTNSWTTIGGGLFPTGPRSGLPVNTSARF